MAKKAAKGRSETAAPAKPRYETKLVHRSYVIEPCPNCQFPEADGGYCPECGWSHCYRGELHL